MNTRALAANILKNVVYRGKSLSSLLPSSLKNVAIKDRAFIQELCYGSLRWWHKLDFIVRQLLHKPLRTKDQDIHCLLIIGIYQILFLDTPNYAAVSATVSAAKFLKKAWASGLINKLLQLFIKQQDSLLTLCEQSLQARFSHPLWFIEKLQKDWPEFWQSILTANNVAPPLFLRVNKQQITRDAYLQLLQQHLLAARAIPEISCAIHLLNPLPANQIPGFAEGLCSIQDIAGQQVADLLNLNPGLSVLDACAAPGSKTCHLLENEPSLKKLVALDKDAERLDMLRQNVLRLKLPVHNLEIKVADASDTKSWWDGQLFDRILVDAPCSATGVIRRHPDIKVLRFPEDIINFTNNQLLLLNSLWPLLKEQGLLIYTTCSVLKDENELVITKFLQQERSAKPAAVQLSLGAKQNYGYQTFPAIDAPDGFFYMVLEK